MSNAETALSECEKYCSWNKNCWGCSVECASNCQWNAIPECGLKRQWNGMIDGDISQKPGNWFSIIYFFKPGLIEILNQYMIKILFF